MAAFSELVVSRASQPNLIDIHADDIETGGLDQEIELANAAGPFLSCITIAASKADMAFIKRVG